MTPAKSEPVQERSIATRKVLLDAAVDCLFVDGYAAFTTTDVSRRAGVSRGAQLHHFPSKADLVSAAVEHLLRRRIEEFWRLFAELHADDDVGAIVDLLWKMFEGPTFAVWAELWIASRSDPELAAQMADIDRRFTEETRLHFVELTSMTGAADPAILEMLRDFAFAVMGGVALQRLVPRGQRPVSDYLSLLKVFITDQLDRAARASKTES